MCISPWMLCTSVMWRNLWWALPVMVKPTSLHFFLFITFYQRSKLSRFNEYHPITPIDETENTRAFVQETFPWCKRLLEETPRTGRCFVPPLREENGVTYRVALQGNTLLCFNRLRDKTDTKQCSVGIRHLSAIQSGKDQNEVSTRFNHHLLLDAANEFYATKSTELGLFVQVNFF